MRWAGFPTRRGRASAGLRPKSDLRQHGSIAGSSRLIVFLPVFHSPCEGVVIEQQQDANPKQHIDPVRGIGVVKGRQHQHQNR